MAETSNKSWIWQGLISNTLSSLLLPILAAAGAIVVGFLRAYGSLFASPILYGLATFFLILGCGVLMRWRKQILFKHVTPTTARVVIREWLDKSGVDVRSVPLSNFRFNYIVTVNSKKIAVGQPEAEANYLHFRCSILFDEADNERLTKSSGGINETLKSLRLHLGLVEIGYTGLQVPLREIVLTKRTFISEDFNEEKFLAALFKVESAFNLTAAIAAP